MNSHNPPRHPRKTIPTSVVKLRLVGESDTSSASDAHTSLALLDEPKAAETAPRDSFLFPLSSTVRGRLLAGVVSLPARPELATQDPVVGRIGHDKLIRSIEATLAKMQSSLDQLDADVDVEIESFRFPTMNDDGPRAA